MFNRRSLPRVFFVIIILVMLLSAALYLRPLPQITPQYVSYTPPAAAPVSLPWPTYGQAAIGTTSLGILETNGTQTPVPIASIAKVFTALAVLKNKPIAVGEEGPTITLDKTDTGFYSYYYANDGSVTRVTAGEQISEYQALQALLLPSSNNMADSLARWAFGSVDAYVAYANQMVKDMGLVDTTIDSPSGFTTGTKSTAAELVKTGILALANPVIAQIVNQQTASIPVAGAVANVNWLLGVEGVDGIKTGNTNEAGGCYLFSASRTVLGQKVQFVGAVVGAPSLNQAISDSKKLVVAADAGFTNTTAIAKDVELGSYSLPWGGTVKAVTKNAVTVLGWQSQQVTTTFSLSKLSAGQVKDTKLGEMTVSINSQVQKVDIVAANKAPSPSIKWRILRK